MADRRLQIFQAVARHLSFTRAAESLFMTQPAITSQIRQFEEQLNARLFERNHGRISLTPAGELTLEYVEKILALSAEMETRISELGGQMQGQLLVGVSTNIAESRLARFLSEFNSLYPQVGIRIQVANSGTITNQTLNHTIDLGLVDAPPHDNPHLMAESCGSDEMLAVCTPQHPLAELNSVSPRELSEYEFVSREPGSGTRALTDHWFLQGGVTPEALKRIMELGSLAALKGVLMTGVGYGIISHSVVNHELKAGKLVAVQLSPPLEGKLSVIFLKDRFRSRLITSFIDFSKRRLREGCL